MNTNTEFSFLRAVLPYAPILSQRTYPRDNGDSFEVFEASLQKELAWVDVVYHFHPVKPARDFLQVHDARAWSEWYNDHSLRGPKPETRNYRLPADRLGEFLRRLASGGDVEEWRYN